MSLPPPPSEKILTRGEVIARFGRPRSQRIVFTNGCFDLLHRGHVEYLYAARSLGDLLILGLNSDASVRALKGPDRPLVGEDDRALIIASLAAVDIVTIFDEETPHELISELLPDLLVKGGDYQRDEIVGREEVEAAGGTVTTIPLVKGRSTTSLIERMKRSKR